MTGAREGVFAGRHAVVTGGSRGIGSAIATALADGGADVTIVSRAIEPGGRVRALRCDVADAGDVRRAFAEAARAAGPIAILVNNAGYADAAAFQDITQESWDLSLATNLTGAFHCVQQVLPAMIAARYGRIVNVASTAGLKGYARVAAYCASKHGLIGLTRALAVETARDGVTVNAVCPGYTEGTRMLDAAIDNIRRTTGRSAEEAREMLLRQSPQRTLVTPEEVASTVCWLCSPEASSITGQAIAVAGGEVM